MITQIFNEAYKEIYSTSEILPIKIGDILIINDVKYEVAQMVWHLDKEVLVFYVDKIIE
jgi:hypothetical protein